MESHWLLWISHTFRCLKVCRRWSLYHYKNMIFSYLLWQFKLHFKNFMAIESHCHLFSIPLSVNRMHSRTAAVGISWVAMWYHVEAERCIHQRFSIPDFYWFLPRERFQHLHSAADLMMAVFWSMYIWKTFSPPWNLTSHNPYVCPFYIFTLH